MGFWSSFKNVYGVFMGTSTDYMKPSKRATWPTHLHTVDENLSIFLGGTGNCGLLRGNGNTLVINCNSGRASKELSQHLQDSTDKHLIVTSHLADYAGGLAHLEFSKTYLPENCEGIQEMQWGDETVQIIPFSETFTRRDVVVFLKNRKMLFTGGLFFNGIHPIIDEQRGVNVKAWVATLKKIKKDYSGTTFAPHEGDLCGEDGLENFIKYLEALSNPEKEFSYCRENFDWHEIPGYTSLEENFDAIRARLS